MSIALRTKSTNSKAEPVKSAIPVLLQKPAPATARRKSLSTPAVEEQQPRRKSIAASNEPVAKENVADKKSSKPPTLSYNELKKSEAALQMAYETCVAHSCWLLL